MIFRLLLVLIVAAGVIGGSAYLAYEVFWRPAKLDAREKREIEEQAKLPPPPHPSIAAFAAAKAAYDAGRTEEAVNQFRTILENDEAAPVAPQVRAFLGELNAREVLSPTPSPNKEAYTVVRGDSLVRIASKTKVGADLIFRTNNLETINLQIGQVLLIPQLDLRGEINREARTLTLYNHGEFFKDYRLLNATVPGLSQGATQEVKVSEKFASREGKRIAFGDKGYVDSDKTVLLAPGGATLRPMPADAETPPPGLVLDPTDLEEIFVLVSRGTPFTIE